MPKLASSSPTASPRRDYPRHAHAHHERAAVPAAVRSKPHLVEVPVAIVTGDYFLPEPLQMEIEALGASLRFKPMWLEDLLALAKTMVSA